ncbi:formiminoglutamate deiminase [Saccharomonospora marina XMU15]|uniref:Formiminoglutamate deiminase n=1 Tax=Saccharomonospora marina XMU15 TaxID=882083 RepID=H5WW99_9PSEU|nr:formimidoylglutamate deiminase [Saccharomonospora marina]EHR49381.1 formiminoglutamate deiminase [Saccharomonospora marina XMU15]
MTAYWCEYAWLPDGVEPAVRLEVTAGRFTSVTTGAPRTGHVLPGLALPGFADVHSNAFQRALRGRAQQGRGSFWTWRSLMYELADRLDPDSYYRLARGVYAELVLAGYTGVGEFHYLHHGPGGVGYADPNAMGAALVAAADEAGIRLCLLDTCYLAGGFGEPLRGTQLRFGDGDAERWAQRVQRFRPRGERVTCGVAVHSVRAVPPGDLPVVAAAAGDRPLHVHLSEQRAENEDCLRASGRTPAGLLESTGVLGRATVAVHATHLDSADIAALAASGSRVCVCPATECDLGDGIGTSRALLDAGVGLCLGGDSHVVTDPFEQLRGLEWRERLAREERGVFTARELLGAGTAHTDIGWPDVGLLAEGQGADLVVVDLDSVRTAGAEPSAAVFAATAEDVRDVMVAGRWVVRDGEHRLVERPQEVLRREIGGLWR